MLFNLIIEKGNEKFKISFFLIDLFFNFIFINKFCCLKIIIYFLIYNDCEVSVL